MSKPYFAAVLPARQAHHTTRQLCAVGEARCVAVENFKALFLQVSGDSFALACKKGEDFATYQA